ncbi:MAG: AsnC family protein, partial [Bacteroidales bacterium]|nr:AsnC family protein [Bacteroidales bacterium]
MDANELTDSIDRKILKIITLNARIPFRDVAEQVGISRT